jgi:signal transduction histidine kinase
MTMSDPIAKLRHDLANPLAAILAETQLMLLGDEPMPDEVRQGLQEIEKLSLRMRTILREIQTPPTA